MAIKLDREQLAVKNTLNNVVVCAGAGAGKTTVLSERFTKLIMEQHIPIENILTLTFTEKAATEMKERIYRVLSSHREDVACDTACKNFEKAHIQTLDSYFSEITKKGAAFYGVNPDFELDDSAVESLIKRKAYEFVNKYKDDERIKALVEDPIKIAKSYFAEPVVEYTNIAGEYDFVEDVEKQADILKSEYDKILDIFYNTIPNLSKDLVNALDKSYKGDEERITQKYISDKNELDKKRKSKLEKLEDKLKKIETNYDEYKTSLDLKLAEGENPTKAQSNKLEKLELEKNSIPKKRIEGIDQIGIELSPKFEALKNDYENKLKGLKDTYNQDKEYLLDLGNNQFNGFINDYATKGFLLETEDIRNSNTKPVVDLIKNLSWMLDSKLPETETLTIQREYYSNLFHILNSVSGYSAVMGLAELTMEFVELIQEEKKTTGLLTFNDVSNLARKILIEQKEIRREEKSKYEKIMIDEFQDNNQMQLDILELLAETNDSDSEAPAMENIYHEEKDDIKQGKLFFVGDEKQSIYAFRGAQVSVFNELQTSIRDESIGGEKLSISTNNRSEPELIAAFNTVFGGFDFSPEQNNPEAKPNPDVNPSLLMTQEWFNQIGNKIQIGINNDLELSSIPDYEASYSKVLMPERKLKYACSKLENDNFRKKMHVVLLNTKPEETVQNANNQNQDDEERKTAELEAEWIARKIQEMTDINNGCTYHKYDREDESKDKDIRYTYDDFAILLKSTTHLPEYLSALQKYNVPYASEVYKDLFADGPISDIYSYLCIYLNRFDTHSYAAVLHSPFVNLSLKDAQLVIQKNRFAFGDLEKNDGYGNSEVVLNQTATNLYNTAKTKFDSFSDFAENASITEVVTYLWYNLGYRYETLKNQTTSMYTYLYDVLFDFARQEENKGGSIASFVRTLAKFKDKDEKLDGIKLPLETKGVHILTIHKSKGLEYECVFVAGISDPGSSDKGEKVWISDEYGYVATVSPDSLYEEIYPNFDPMIRKGASSSTSQSNYFYHNGQSILDRKNKSAAELRRLAYVAFTRAIDQLYLVGHFNNEFDKEKIISNEVGIIGQIHPTKKIQLTTREKDATYTAPSNIYTLMLPVLNRYISKDKKEWAAAKTSPFDLEIFTARDLENTDSITEECGEKKVQPNNNLLHYCLESFGFEIPSSLELSDKELRERKCNARTLENVDELINQVQEKLFDTNILARNDFGTIAHSYMEQAMLSENFNKSPDLISSEESSELLEILDDEQKQLIETACRKMIEDFRNWFTKEFGAPEKMNFVKPEFPFRYFNGHVIIHGTMDLVFESSPGNFVIIDYKTDEKIIKEKYEPQLNCYKDAIKAMFPNCKSVKCYLYLLRNGEPVELF